MYLFFWGKGVHGVAGTARGSEDNVELGTAKYPQDLPSTSDGMVSGVSFLGSVIF